MKKEHKVAVFVLVAYTMSLLLGGFVYKVYWHPRRCIYLQKKWNQAINSPNFSWGAVEKAQNNFDRAGCFND